jgi:plasmid replication initiation protein
LKQYQAIGRRTIKIEALRGMLGIEPQEYDRYNDFKRYVLQAAHREINEKTDISFDYREIKLCRKVNELEFVIAKKTASGTPCRAAAPVSARDKIADRRKKKIDGHIEKLSPDERDRLAAEANEKAQRECPALYRDREVVPEQVVRGYMVEIMAEKIGKGRGKEKNKTT